MYDCSAFPPSLNRTYKAKGVNNAAMVIQTSEYVFWCNKSGVFGYTQGQIVDLLTKIDTSRWRALFNAYTHPVYDPENNLLLIFGKKAGESLNDKRALIIDLSTGTNSNVVSVFVCVGKIAVCTPLPSK